ncbi:hypothetical protein [Roseivirga misakiensis]|uniref:Uncharacterized protein n=1 Tax=Roseivirga misakiensis TaxID=1563681 RepID=A0A1E5SLB5_9BACT|nr:hypothetical protein [Roseivirga misakiensis]OEJ99917.1 hypothetical protein BFP71_10245 [Roseivirga misakiensis]
MRKYKTIKVSDYELMLNRISNADSLDLETHDLLLYGSGGQDRNFYRYIEANKNCELLWTGWSGPKWSSIFSFIPGQAGLLKLLDKREFKSIYYELAASSVSDAIYLPRKQTKKIVIEAQNKTWRSNFAKLLNNEPHSFLLTSEADETVNKNGDEMYFYDYFLGSNLDSTLKEIIRGKKKNTVVNNGYNSL